jgi:phosphoribosylaminoimidazole (AIR) synthetase
LDARNVPQEDYGEAVDSASREIEKVVSEAKEGVGSQIVVERTISCHECLGFKVLPVPVQTYQDQAG